MMIGRRIRFSHALLLVGLLVGLALLGAAKAPAPVADREQVHHRCGHKGSCDERTAPRTTISSAPSDPAGTSSASFEFSSSEAGSTFECRLDQEEWSSCTSPKSYVDLVEGAHTFAVRAKGAAGQVDGTPASRSWTVDAKLPQPSPPADPAPPDASPDQPSPGNYPAPESTVLFSDDFAARDGLITNHYAYWTDDPNAHRSPDWETEGGSLFRRGESGWTGVPDSVRPDIHSLNGNGSAVFRLWTRRSDFGDVKFEADLRNNGFTAGTAQRPPMDWDGIKLMLRRTGESYYAVDVHTRQGYVMIQKKCLGGDVQGGTYYVLAQSGSWSHSAPLGSWDRAGATARNNPDGSVTVEVVRDGAVVLEATDWGTGCAPYTAPQGLGIRGDNTDFNIDNVTVTALG